MIHTIKKKLQLLFKRLSYGLFKLLYGEIKDFKSAGKDDNSQVLKRNMTWNSDMLYSFFSSENYDDMRLSLEKGKLTAINPTLPTICDALTVNIAGNLTFKINKKILLGGLTVSEDDVIRAVNFLKKELNVVAEPGGAAAVAAFLSKYNDFKKKVVVIVVSGGNIDSDLLKKITDQNDR